MSIDQLQAANAFDPVIERCLHGAVRARGGAYAAP